MDEMAVIIRKRVLERLDLSKEAGDEEIMELIAEEAAKEPKVSLASIRERINLEQGIFNSLRRLDAIEELVEDPAVTEIMVNGPKSIFYEKEGRVYRWNGAFSSEERLQDILQQIVAGHNRVINLSSPIVDTRLKDGSRVNIVLTPISVDGSALTIRKFPEKPYTMDQLISMDSISAEGAEFLKLLVQCRYSMVISGGTGSGKTTFLNALSQYIPSDERIITIEDSAELQIQGIPNLVRLETRNANVEGVTPVFIRDLIKTALRMRPDRIIVGECRGAEAFDMLQAMNTGHDGSLSTGHANSCADILSRLEMMVLMGMDLPLSAIRRQIVSGINVIVHLGRLRDKSRRVLEISELCGIEQGEIVLNPIYQFRESGENRGKVSGELMKVGTLKNRSRLESAGLSLKEDRG